MTTTLPRLLLVLLLTLMVLFLVGACENLTGSQTADEEETADDAADEDNGEETTDDTADGDTVVPLDGMYVGYWELLSSSTTVPPGTADTVFTLKIDGSVATLTVLGPAGQFLAEGEVDLEGRSFSGSGVFTTPTSLTASFTGIVTDAGAVEGVLSVDYNSDESVDESGSITGTKNDEGHILRGTLTLPDGAQGQNGVGAVGTPYVVVADSNGNGDDGGQVAFFAGVASDSREMCYVLNGVPAGEWELYAVLYLNASSSEPPLRAPAANEFTGSYQNPDESYTITVSDDNGVYDFYLEPDIMGMYELQGSWDVTDDGFGTQQLTFYPDTSDGLVAAVDWSRTSEEYAGEGSARVVYIDARDATRIAVLYHYYHSDEMWQNKYSKFTWTEPIGTETKESEFSFFDEYTAFADALADSTPSSEAYPLTATLMSGEIIKVAE